MKAHAFQSRQHPLPTISTVSGIRCWGFNHRNARALVETSSSASRAATRASDSASVAVAWGSSALPYSPTRASFASDDTTHHQPWDWCQHPISRLRTALNMVMSTALSCLLEVPVLCCVDTVACRWEINHRGAMPRGCSLTQPPHVGTWQQAAGYWHCEQTYKAASRSGVHGPMLFTAGWRVHCHGGAVTQHH